MSTQRAWRAYARDAALAVVIAGGVVAGAGAAPPGRTQIDPLGYVLLAVGGLVLAARRRAPIAVLLVTTGCVLGYLLRGYPGVGAAVPVMVALFTAVRSGHRRIVAVPGAALVAVVLTDLTLVHGQAARQVFQDRVLLAGWLVASGVLGEAFRQWAAYVDQAEQRAAEAERTREEAARRRAGEERLRIARELHDSLTHSISIIKVQTGVAIHLARKRGEEVPETLLAVQEASREAMRELRATLEVLRGPEDETTGSGLDRLDDLVERARSAGLPATVTVSGSRRALPAAVDRAAFRIVQEALTNVSRHAGPASASVHIRYGADELTVQVDDDGRGPAEGTAAPGVGLVGMRERVAALGGRLRAEPRTGGGFSVRAELPVGDLS
ncbi:sensor histidine kinase [Actinomadura scrupuli]|uniref:sensor histidine kinase n=1 Tax=Actinomadura scrupuli TaxID=559629 RepID=UPI003D995CB2